jgi:glycoprotein-N-acetylgalactosamine 3-beta-galactosyltransferase
MRGDRDIVFGLVVVSLCLTVLSIRFSTVSNHYYNVGEKGETSPSWNSALPQSSDRTTNSSLLVSLNFPSREARELLFNETTKLVLVDDSKIATENNNVSRTTVGATTPRKVKKRKGGKPRPHPHAGARDVDGSWGYVADVTLVRRRMLDRYRKSRNSRTTSEEQPPISYLPIQPGTEFQVVCNTEPRRGKERKAGWRLLAQKVVVDGPNPLPPKNATSLSEQTFHQHTTTAAATAAATTTTATTTTGTTTAGTSSQHHDDSSVPRPKILCAVYTYEKRHASVTAIGETWGWRCDGFFAASTRTVVDDPDKKNADGIVYGLGAVDLPHEGKEEYENMWMKTRSILAYMYDNYLNEFDFFFLAGDDTFLIVENLRRTLESMGRAAWEEPLYLGHWIPDMRGGYYCGGGAGYVLNRRSLEILIRDVFPNCMTNDRTPAEDRALGDCFRTVGIVGNHSVDATNAQRFHGLDPHQVSSSKGEKGFYRDVYTFWGELYGFKTGFELTSSQSVSFHLMSTPAHLKRHHAILYKSCPRNTTIGDILLNDTATVGKMLTK